MVRIFAIQVNNLPDPWENPEIMEGLPEERKEKISRIKREGARKESLGAGILLEYAKKQYVDADTKFLNLSHSGDMAVCVAGDKAVGCDIEMIRDAHPGLAQRFFCESEVKYLDSVEQYKRKDEFIRLWTIKESYMKMTGKGLALGLDSFEIIIDKEIHLKKDETKVPCYIKEYNLDGYKLSVCSEENNFEEKIYFLKELDLRNE